MPPLATASSSSSDSSHYVPPPVGYTGILSILAHYGVDASNLSLNVLRSLRDMWVRTPPAMRPAREDEAIMARQILLHRDEASGRYIAPGLPNTEIMDPGSS